MGRIDTASGAFRAATGLFRDVSGDYVAREARGTWRVRVGRLPDRENGMVAERDLYAILGVARGASKADIRKAFRKIAVADHPDRNPGNAAAEERFKNATYASEILLDDQKRALYDEFGEIGVKDGFNVEAARAYSRGGRVPRGAAGAGGFGGGFDPADLEDLLRGAQRGGGGFGGGPGPGGGASVFESLFGGRAGVRQRPDVTSEITIDFADSLRGVERELQFTGTESKLVKARIPAGVANGGKVRLRGQAPDGADLVLVVHVRPHPQFSRDGLDLLLQLPVTVVEAMRGARVEVPTLDGPVTLVIPAGVSGGAKLRLKGKGVRRGDKRGDLIAELRIVMPPKGAGGLESAVAAFEQAYLGTEPRADLKL